MSSTNTPPCTKLLQHPAHQDCLQPGPFPGSSHQAAPSLPQSTGPAQGRFRFYVILKHTITTETRQCGLIKLAPELRLNTLSETALAVAFQFQLNHLAFVMRRGNRNSDSTDDTTYTSIKLCANNACGYFANTCEQAWRFGSH